MIARSDLHTDGVYRRSLAVTLAALLVGLIYVSPHVAFMLELGDDYKYPFLGMVDERLYVAKIQEAYQGNFLRADPYLLNYLIGNPYLLEHKDGIYEHPPVSEIGLALLFRAFGLSLEDGMVLCDFFFPALTFVLLYLFLWFLTRSSGVSLIGAAFVMLSSIVILGMPHLLLEFLGKIGIAPQELIPNSSYLLSRAVSPQLYIIPFLVTMISIHALYRGKGYAFVILGGICQGFHYYIAPFYWALVLMGSALLCGYVLFVEKDRRRFFMIIALNGVGLFLALPYWIQVYQLMNTPEFLETAQRHLYHTRKIFLTKRGTLTILCFLILYRKKDSRYFFFASFMLGSVICQNQQVITGRTLPNFHFIYTSGLIAVISMVVLYENLTNETTGLTFLRFLRRGKWAIVTGAAVALFLLINAAYVQTNSYLADRLKPIGLVEVPRVRWKEYQSLHKPFRWLSTNADSRKEVVIASEEVSGLLVSFTDFKVLVNRFAHVTLTSEDKWIDRWLIRFRLYGISNEALDSFLDRDLLPYYNPYMPFIYNWYTFADEKRGQKAKERLLERYRHLTQEPLPELLKGYHVRYVFLSRFEQEEYGGTTRAVDLSKYGFLTKVYDSEGIKIYRVM